MWFDTTHKTLFYISVSADIILIKYKLCQWQVSYAHPFHKEKNDARWYKSNETSHTLLMVGECLGTPFLSLQLSQSDQPTEKCNNTPFSWDHWLDSLAGAQSNWNSLCSGWTYYCDNSHHGHSYHQSSRWTSRCGKWHSQPFQEGESLKWIASPTCKHLTLSLLLPMIQQLQL